MKITLSDNSVQLLSTLLSIATHDIIEYYEQYKLRVDNISYDEFVRLINDTHKNLCNVEPSPKYNQVPLIEAVAELLISPYTRSLISNQQINELRELILRPNEQQQAIHYIKNLKLSCNGCGRKVHDSTELVNVLIREKSLLIRCTMCLGSFDVKCCESGCNNLVSLPKRLIKQITSMKCPDHSRV